MRHNSLKRFQQWLNVSVSDLQYDVMLLTHLVTITSRETGLTIVCNVRSDAWFTKNTTPRHFTSSSKNIWCSCFDLETLSSRNNKHNDMSSGLDLGPLTVFFYLNFFPHISHSLSSNMMPLLTEQSLFTKAWNGPWVEIVCQTWL